MFDFREYVNKNKPVALTFISLVNIQNVDNSIE